MCLSNLNNFLYSNVIFLISEIVFYHILTLLYLCKFLFNLFDKIQNYAGKFVHGKMEKTYMTNIIVQYQLL